MTGNTTNAQCGDNTCPTPTFTLPLSNNANVENVEKADVGNHSPAHTPDSGMKTTDSTPSIGICSTCSKCVSSPNQSPRTVESHPLHIDSFPTNIINMSYEVRGMVAKRAMKIGKQLQDYSFSKLLECHIGNPHAVGSPPLTYIREILSLLTSPKVTQMKDLDEDSEEYRNTFAALCNIYDQYAVRRALRYARSITDVGAYTGSRGALILREDIADWFARRDGHRPDVDSIFLTNGASDGIKTTLALLISNELDCILLPRPQYPLYSATICRLGGQVEFYELDEDDEWRTSADHVRDAFNRAVAKGYNPKAVAVISPGNPAPTLLTADIIGDILTLASELNFAVLADEVYQENVYDAEFTSFRSVLTARNLDTQLVSYHSSSKGFYGECGFRGGLAQFENINEDAMAQLFKLRSVELCSNTIGQVCMALVCTPPTEEEPSLYEQFVRERNVIIDGLKWKAQYTTDFFNSLEGVTCTRIAGALYAFPNIQFSERSKAIAREKDIPVETYYCLSLLEDTGIVTTPGSGFGQAPGTHHLRMTILPTQEDLISALARFGEFHHSFVQDHKD